MMRRFAIALFACRSRSVSGIDRTTDVKSVPKPRSTRPPRPLARSLLIRSPRPAAPRTGPRPIVQDDAIHHRADSCQLDLDFSGPRLEARMLRGLGYEPVDDQSEPPASLWLERKRFGCRVPAGYSFDPATNGAWRSPSCGCMSRRRSAPCPWALRAPAAHRHSHATVRPCRLRRAWPRTPQLGRPRPRPG